MNEEDRLKYDNVRMVQGAVRELIENEMFTLDIPNLVRVDNKLYLVTIQRL